ncbi:MAG TPA: hypothetical protein VNK23_02810 [Candidatus Dormibacteraeota bacterium]|nr:hypothetical protein [Candidatus Dormibacteraeota bacterium]
MFALPKCFLARALQLFEIGGSESAHAAAHAIGIGLKALDELGDPRMTYIRKAGDTVGGPFARVGIIPPLPDELLDDVGFEAAAPRQRSTLARRAGFLDITKARPAGPFGFVA